MLPGQKLSPNFAVSVLRRRFVWLLVPTVVCGFAALIVSSRLTNRYQAETLMRLIPQRVPDTYVRSTVLAPITTRLESVSREVMSRSGLEELIRELELFPAERTRMPIEDVVNVMRANIEVEMVQPARGQPMDAFHVRFTYPDPVMAAQTADRLSELFVQENARDRGDLADATNEFLESQLGEARTRLEQQERKLESFRMRHAGRLPSQLDSNTDAMRNAQMQTQAIVESLARDRDRKLMLERMYHEAELEPVPVPASAVQPAARPADNNIVAASGSSQQQLETARATLSALELRLRPGHPDVIRTKRQIVELEQKIAADAAAREKVQESGQAATAPPTTQPLLTTEAAQRTERLRQMRAELDSLARQLTFKEGEEQRLRGVIADYQQRIETVPTLESEWAVLNRDYETQSNAYKDLLVKSEQSKVAADLEKRQIGEQFRVVDTARVPNRPTSPVRVQISAVGVGIGLVIGLALVALLEVMDSSFRTRAEVVSVLSLPVLARVPLVESAAEESRRQRRKLMVSAAVAAIAVSASYVFWAMRLWKYVV